MQNKLSWDDLRLFLSIIRAGSLTSAARSEGLSQPTLGRRLQHIEAKTGQPLVQRSAGRYVPTEIGRLAVAAATKMEEEIHALDRRLHASKQVFTGLLRLSSSEWFSRHILTPRLVSFRALHPGIVIELLAETRLLNLDRRDADVVFRFRRFEDQSVLQRHFAHVEYGVFASACVAKRISSADAASVGLILMDTALADLIDVEWLTTRLPRNTVTFRSNSRDIQAAACVAGCGLAVLPLMMGAAYGLEIVELDEPAPSREVWLGYHPDLHDHPPTRALITHLSSQSGILQI